MKKIFRIKSKILAFTLLALICASGCEEEKKQDDMLLNLALLQSATTRTVTTPVSVSYSWGSRTLSTDQAIPERIGKPTILSGQPNSFTVSPALPAGLTLNPTTGLISGTPLNVSAAFTIHTITVRNTVTNSTSSTYSISINQILNSSANITCNTAGIAAGCTAGAPYSCTNSGLCYTTTTGCLASNSCTY